MAVLALSSLTLSGARVKAEHGARDLAEARMRVAAEGGGVLFVRHPEDCSATDPSVVAVAGQLEARGITVRGVIIRRGPVQTAMEVARRRFPHALISPYATTSLIQLGHTRTPLALAINEAASVTAIEPVDRRPAQVIAAALLAGRDG